MERERPQDAIDAEARNCEPLLAPGRRSFGGGRINCSFPVCTALETGCALSRRGKPPPSAEAELHSPATGNPSAGRNSSRASSDMLCLWSTRTPSMAASSTPGSVTNERRGRTYMSRVGLKPKPPPAFLEYRPCGRNLSVR